MIKLRTPSAVYYRDKITEEDERIARSKDCAKICAQNESAYVTPCSAQDMDLRPHFVGRQANKTALKHLQGQAIYTDADLSCWHNLPTISIAQKPTNFVGDVAAEKEKQSKCYQCMLKTQVFLQTKNGVGPDKRFWVGAAAAGTGVLLAVLVGVIRRG